MRRDLYFINEMSPAVHVFVCRLILQFHNEKSNNKIKKQQSKLFPADMSFNQLGQLCQHFGDEINGIQTSTVGSMEMPDHGSGTVDQQSDIITQHTFPKAACVSDRSSDVVALHLNELSQIESALNSSARENYSTFSSLMLSTFEEKIRELTNIWDNLSDEERRAMSLNMDYVTNVLFKCPSERRLSEVASVFVGGHFIQWQGNTNYCGLCAVNNIIGSTADGIFPVLIADMDHIADELWLNMAGDPLVPLTFLIPALRDREGFYSGEVIIKTIERRSYSTTRLQHDVLSATEDNEILENLMSFNEIKGLIIRKFNEAHWISIPIIDSNFTLIDPKVKTMRTLSSSDVCQLVRSHCFHPGAVYIVQKDTCQTGTDENIESTDVEETGEEIIQNEVKVKPPKSVEDNSRNTDENEHTQNEEENSSKDTPEISEIDVTQVTWLNKDSPDDTEVGNNEEEEIDEGQYNLESVWLSNIDSALNHIFGIMICDDSKCDEVDHERHHEFLRTPNRVQEREHDTYGFGYYVFSENKNVRVTCPYELD
ncbi:uncharacterized protein LOC143046560 [Mytilus galloprovincialis]|uniref:uncharacterized protein LOC143046560 n=1 Tax=Mytilus galloprovincialis TaxID=29158 RepID=UPI003F7C68B3